MLYRSQDLVSQYRISAETAERELPAARAALDGAIHGLEHAKGQGRALAGKLQGLQMSLGHLAHAFMSSLPPHRMLHECFSIRDPETFDRELLPALDVIMGERLCFCCTAKLGTSQLS